MVELITLIQEYVYHSNARGEGTVGQAAKLANTRLLPDWISWQDCLSTNLEKAVGFQTARPLFEYPG